MKSLFIDIDLWIGITDFKYILLPSRYWLGAIGVFMRFRQTGSTKNNSLFKTCYININLV